MNYISKAGMAIFRNCSFFCLSDKDAFLHHLSPTFFALINSFCELKPFVVQWHKKWSHKQSQVTCSSVTFLFDSRTCALPALFLTKSKLTRPTAKQILLQFYPSLMLLNYWRFIIIIIASPMNDEETFIFRHFSVMVESRNCWSFL